MRPTGGAFVVRSAPERRSQREWLRSVASQLPLGRTVAFSVALAVLALAVVGLLRGSTTAAQRAATLPADPPAVAPAEVMSSPTESTVAPSVSTSESASAAVPVAAVAPSLGSERNGWQAVMAALAARRTAALSARDPQLLVDVYASGALAMAADTDAIVQLRRGGVRVRGLELAVEGASLMTPVTSDDKRARLLVTDRLSAYELVDGAGRLVEAVPPRESTDWLVELVIEDGEWQIATITEAGPGQPPKG